MRRSRRWRIFAASPSPQSTVLQWVAGWKVAMACDIRIAEEQAQMALPEAGVGLLPCAGGANACPGW